MTQVEKRGYTDSQKQEAMKRFWRTHCFKAYGSEDWMKILLALGHCRSEVIDIANDVLSTKILKAAGRVAATHGPPADPRLSKRTAAAMTGQPIPEVQPPNTGLGNEAKRLREKAKNLGREMRLLLWNGSMRRRALVEPSVVSKFRCKWCSLKI